MKKTLIALAAAGGLMLVPATAQAHPEVTAKSPAACHGMIVKTLSTNGYSPGQLKQLSTNPNLNLGDVHKALKEICVDTGHLPPGQAKK